MTKTEGNTARKPRRMARELKPAGTGAPASTSNDVAVGQPKDTSQAASPPATAIKPQRAASKASLVLEMLRRPEGATLDQMVAATGWLPHTTRAVLTGFKKKGHTVTSEKADGGRTYWVDRAGSAEAADAANEPVVG